jgi:hypothetical protein
MINESMGLTAHQQEILRLVHTEQKTGADAARLFNIHPATPV